MSTTGPSFSLPHARLPVLQQLPLDSITVYDTATHCYLLGTDSLQKNYYLLSLRKHTPEHISSSGALGSSNGATSAGNDAHQSTPASDSEAEGGREGAGATCLPSDSHALSSGLDDLHDFTSYVVYSQTEAGALVDALQREHGALMRTLSAVALLGAVRFTAGYYVVLVTERRMAGYLGAHRIFEAASAELVSLQLDPEWVAEAEAQSREKAQRLHLSDGVAVHGVNAGFLSFVLQQAATGGCRKPSSPLRSRLAKALHSRKSPSCAGTGGSSASAASYLFSRRSLEEQYRQQFVSSLSRASSFFYSHSYDLTNTLQRNMLAAGSTMADGPQAATPPGGDDGGSDVGAGPYPSAAQPLQPRMQYVWNEYLLEPWELSHRDFSGDEAEASENATTANECDTAQEELPAGGAGRETVPQYPSALSRWRVFLVHGYITQRVLAIRRPTFQTLLVTLIARVSKGSAGVRYHRRGLNSDGHVANHVEVEQIITDEASWNPTFTAGALSSYVQLRGSVPVRWYHPLKASRLLPKPPIVIGPHDSQWSETCLHFQKLVEQYGCPIIVHDLLKCQEGKARESLLGDAYRQAVRALAAAVDRAATLTDSKVTGRDADKGSDTKQPPHICSCDVLRYETTDLRRLGQLAWNTMTATAEQHFRTVRCFVTRRCSSATTTGLTDRRGDDFHRGNLRTTEESNEFPASYEAAHGSDGDSAEVVQLQNGVVRSNCLDCIDRTNLGQLFHGLHALGEQLSALGFLRNAPDVCNSPAVMEMLLEMYLAMGDAIAIQYGGSAQVGAGVLHRGAGWDQLMGVKRLYNNVVGDREKQEAMNLFLGRKQPQPRPGSRACNAEMHSPAQIVCLSSAQVPSPSTSAFAGVGRGSPVRKDDAASSASLFSGFRKAASRWWNEAGSSSGLASGAAATTTALRVSSHTSVEVEAEADYYDQVSGAPRLPPAGLLASWWVRPLCRFDMWYAARGVHPRPRTVRGVGNAEDAVSESSMREVPAPHLPHRSSVTEDLSSNPAAFHGPLPMPCGSVSAPDSEVFPEVYSGDELALRILAAETQAQKHWLLFIATVERQASLAPLRRDETTHLHEKCKGTPRDGSTSDTSAALHLSSLSCSISGGVAPSGPLKVPQRVRWSHEGDSILQGLIRPLGQDDVGEMTTGMASITSSSSSGGAAGILKSCDLPREESPLVSVSEGAHSAPSVPLLAAPLRLFTEPWVILHTTTHLLPMETVTSAASLSALALRMSAAVFPPSSLPRPSTKCAARIDLHSAPCCEPSYGVKQAVAHHLFGRLPPAVADITAHSPPRIPEEQYQPWQSPRRIHSHDAFPRIVRNSLFAQQDAHLERLAYREVLWLEEDADTPAAKARGAVAEPLKQPASDPSMTQLLSPRMVPWALSLHEVADHQFVAAMIVNRFGTPTVWGIGVITQVLQYLLYPERLSEEVLRVLLSSKIQPPLTGAELLSTGAFVSIEGEKGMRELRWNAAARRHWHERLVAPLGPTYSAVVRNPSDAAMTHHSTPTTSLQGSVGEETPLRRTRSAPFSESSLAQPRHTGEKQSWCDPVGVAAALLCRLARILHFAKDNKTDSVTSAGYTCSTPAEAVRGNEASVTTFTTPRQSYDAGSAQGGCTSVVNVSKATAPYEETMSHAYAEAALLPLLETCSNLRFPASAYLPGLFPQHKNLSDSLRQQWLLCSLLEPIFPRFRLTPPTLHDLLHDFFSALLLDDGPVEDSLDVAAGRSRLCRRRSDCHVRYTFVLRHPQTKSMQQWTSRQLSSDGAGGSARCSEGRFSYRLAIGTSPLLSSSQPQELPSTHGDMTSSVPPATSKILHIPATLKVNHCCAALDLYHWSVAHSPLFATSSLSGSRGASLVSRDGPRVNTTTALAVWRLLWWAVDNNFIVPVVRGRGQGTLEMLADETALFCLRRDVVRVALNVERHCREDVWCPQQPETLTTSATLGGGSSAIYGVDLAPSVSRLYRPLCRSAMARILALSETLASLGLNAATRVQEFFRDRIVHGWARQSFGSVVLTTTAASTTSSSNAGSGSSAVTAATVVRCFHQLAEECLRSVYSVMVALRHVSLAAFARDAAMHSYIVFFVNVYNAAYVAAWITNVKELVSNGAAAAAADANSPQKNSHRSQYPGPPRKPKLRTIDLFPLPTLCNTNHACFMHAYGVDIGGLFLSLEEIKYGILGGNRAPPYCDLPLWPPVASSGADQLSPLRLERSSGLSGRQQVQQLVPLHLCAEVAESARLEALQSHPHLQAALDLTDMCEALDPFREEETGVDGDGNSAYAKTVRQPPSSTGLGLMSSWSSSSHLPCVLQPSSSSSVDVPGPSENPTWQSARGSLTPASPMSPSQVLPCSSSVGEKRRRRQKLVDLWSLDVVRYLPFRILLQLIDTYLPPPVLHLCAGSVDMEGRESFGGIIGGSGPSSTSGSASTTPARDLHNIAHLDGRDTVPWFLQPIFNTMSLVHDSLQSSKVGATYTVALDGDGPAAGTLVPQVSQDANGVLLQQCRMWSNPSYYIVGGDGASCDEAVSRSLQLLQALAGSYIGAGLYHPIQLDTAGSGAADTAPRGPAQHLCRPLHADEPFAQFLSTEAAFRSAILTTDPHIFRSTSASSSPPPAKSSPQMTPTSRRMRPPPSPLMLPTDFSHPLHLRGIGGNTGMYANIVQYGARGLPGGSGSSNASCSATLQNIMKPILYEWCRSLEEGTSHITSPPGYERQMLATLKMVRLLEESHASGKAVRAAQAAMRSD